MAGVARESAIERERAGAICLELKRGRAAGGHAFRDAVFVDGEAVGDIFAADRQLDQVVLHDLDPRRRVVEVLRDNREFAPVGGFLRQQAARGRGSGHDDPADAEEQQTERTAGHSHTKCDEGRTVLVRQYRFRFYSFAAAGAASCACLAASSCSNAVRLSRILPVGSILITFTRICWPSFSSSRTSLMR